MRVLLAHNRYRQAGGEDVAVESERQLLTAYGHDVGLLEVDNAGIVGMSGKLSTALGVVYSAASKAKVANQIQRLKPDVVHVHNTFPLLSPSIYFACKEANIPVVQTLHNYRMVCPSALLHRSGGLCEECIGKDFAWPGILHACYRGSRLGTASVATMTWFHKVLGTWTKRVDVFVVLTEFAKRKLGEGGLPMDKMVIKPNFASNPGSMGDGGGGFALFVGRLSAEKGIATLISAWLRKERGIGLKIVGEGPLASEVAECAKGRNIEYLGGQPRGKVLALMRKAHVLICPSIWYEGFPMVIVEAFSVGLPVIASNLGSMSSVVAHELTGLLCYPGDPEDLSTKIEWVVNNKQQMPKMRRAARSEYLGKYTPEQNHQRLMEIYDRVIAWKKLHKRRSDQKDLCE